MKIQIQIFADWLISDAKRVTKDHRKKSRISCRCRDKENADEQKLSRKKKIFLRPYEMDVGARGTFQGSSHVYKTESWYLSGVLFKISDEHSHPSYMRVPLRDRSGEDQGIFKNAKVGLDTIIKFLKNLSCIAESESKLTAKTTGIVFFSRIEEAIMRRDFFNYKGLGRDTGAALAPIPSRPNCAYALAFTDNQTLVRRLTVNSQESRLTLDGYTRFIINM